MENSARFPRGKPAAPKSLYLIAKLITSLVYAVFLCVTIMRPAVKPKLFLRQRMGMRSLTCAHIGVHAVHTKGGQAQTRLHKS